MEVDEEIRDMITPQHNPDQIKQVWRKKGKRTMWENALDLVSSGTTAVDEVKRTILRD